MLWWWRGMGLIIIIIFLASSIPCSLGFLYCCHVHPGNGKLTLRALCALLLT